MKIGVIKLGARITWDTDAAVGPGEAISICKALTQGGAEVHVYTKILAKDTLDTSIVWHNILEDHRTTSPLDALLVINGNVNFFGGAEDRAQILNYVLLNNYLVMKHGPVLYVMCDPELPLQQIWENVSKKQDDPKYKWENKYLQCDIEITKPIHVLCQPFNVQAMQAYWAKKSDVPLGKMIHFPMERFPLLNEWLPPNPTPTVDLLYGGTARGGRRIPNLYRWYWNLPEDISVEIFGKIDLDDFYEHPKIKRDLLPGSSGVKRSPVFTGMVKYCDVLPKMNNALAHLVTGDPSYETLDLIPQRIAECMAAGNIVFVDANIDTSRRIYPVGTLENEFLYVQTQDDLVQKIRLLKQEPGLRTELLIGQTTVQKFDADQFCKSLVQLVSTLMDH